MPLRDAGTDRELDDEVRAYLELLIDEKIAAGIEPSAARRQALIELEGLQQIKERVRDTRRWSWLADAWQDAGYGLRLLRRNPGFAAVVVLTLALGIGANTAIFTVVNGVLFRALPYPDPDRLMSISGTNPTQGQLRVPLSVADFLDWRSRNRIFEPLAAYANTLLNYTGGEGAEQIAGLSVTADFFRVLGVGPALGRTLLPHEDKPESDQVAIVSDAFWRRYLGSDPARIGQPITLSGRIYTVVGVMPPRFTFGLTNEVGAWVAMKLAPPARRGPYFMWGIARLRHGASVPLARTEMAAIAGGIREATRASNNDWNLVANDLKEEAVGDVRPALLALLGAVLLVMLIACANIANLLLARATTREKEVAVRTALGAGRGRLVRQLLTESLLLGLTGGGLGVLLAVWGVNLLLASAPPTIPRLKGIHVDGLVLAFAVALAFASAVVFGLAPAAQSAQLGLVASLKEGRGAGEGDRKRRMRSVLAIAEIALALMLLITTGLVLKSFANLQRVDVGVRADNVVTMQISLPGSRYRERAQLAAFWGRLLERIEALPGVRSAAVGLSLPPNLLSLRDDFAIDGRLAPPTESSPIADLLLVSPRYFETLGIRLREGRTLANTDTADAPRVVVINETMKRRFFAAESPIGKRIKQGTASQNPWMDIVGVVDDVKYGGVGVPTEAAMYEPYMQNPGSPMYLVVRTAADPMGAVPAIRDVVRALDKDLPVIRVRSMSELIYQSKAEPRFRALLLGVFGLAALLLAAVGIYGVISYSVTQRTHEMGVRMALGAARPDVMRLILIQGSKLVLLGTAVGLAGSALITRSLATLLFAVEPHDPWTFAGVALLMAGTALAAILVPAARATRVDPLVALRSE